MTRIYWWFVRISKIKRSVSIWIYGQFYEKLLDWCKFFSSWKEECISGKDYLYAINVRNTFKMNTMGDYHDLYLRTDVLLLADFLEKFVNTCLNFIWMQCLKWMR